MTGRALPSPSPFAGDDGRADPIVQAVLAEFVGGRPDHRALQHALVGARLLTPIVATAAPTATPAAATDATAVDGHTHARVTDLATVAVQGRDGRRALPVFTSLETLAAWDPSARPFPLTAVDAARGAFAEGLAALLVDPRSVPGAVIEGPALLALAENRWWLEPAADPEVVAAVREALAGLPGLASVDVTAGREADLTVTLFPSADAGAAVPGADAGAAVPGADAGAVVPGADAGAARALAQAAAERLATVDVLRTRLARGLDLTVSPHPA